MKYDKLRTLAVSFGVLFSGLLLAGPAFGQAPAPTTSGDATGTATPVSDATEVSSDPYAGLDQTGTPSLPRPGGELPKPSVTDGKKRKRPRYDGRRAARPTTGQVLVWIPRIIFFPVYLTFEYLIRWPIVQLITVLEKYHVIERLKRFFTFSDGKGLFLPTIFVDFQRFASVGLFMRIKDLGYRHHNLTLQAGFWTGRWYHAVATDTFKVFRNDRGTVKLRAEFMTRPDQVFHGLGPRSLQAGKAFFRWRRTDVDLSLRARLKNLNRVSLGIAYRNSRISGGKDRSISDPGLASFYDVNDPNEVPGFGAEYNLITARLKLDLDTRSPDRLERPGTGLRLELGGSFSVDPAQTRLNFFRWGGELAGFWDVSRRNHVFALRVYTEALEQTGPHAVPFTERIWLGGKEHLRGFLEGRFRGDSATVATFSYRYPIWYLLDASLFVSVGNVWNGRFRDFAFKRMVMVGGVALRTSTDRDVSFDILVAFGTNQFDLWRDNFRVDSVRVTAGVNQGF